MFNLKKKFKGNDGSAFVEALVSRSGDDGDSYEVSLSISYKL